MRMRLNHNKLQGNGGSEMEKQAEMDNECQIFKIFWKLCRVLDEFTEPLRSGTEAGSNCVRIESDQEYKRIATNMNFA